MRTCFAFRGLAAAAGMMLCATAHAQSNPRLPTPYAAIDPEKVGYAGPDRATSRDLTGPEIKIGLLVPLQGPRKAEGEALRLAARLALQDQSDGRPDEQPLSLAVGDESGPWGRASSEIARLVFDGHAAAIITSAEGTSAHLAEQIGNRIGVPILTLATDTTTTEINLPWIFRLVPDDRAQAEAFARAIYSDRGYRRVLLVVERNHDGRLGAREFEKASSRWSGTAPDHIELDSTPFDVSQALASIQSRRPEAVVLWAAPAIASSLAYALRRGQGAPAVFLCQKSAAASGPPSEGKVWTVSRRGISAPLRQRFRARFEALAGRPPSPETEASYDAMRLVAAALRQAGPNRARLRDQLARVSGWSGVSGEVSFDGAGNNLAPIEIVPVP